MYKLLLLVRGLVVAVREPKLVALLGLGKHLEGAAFAAAIYEHRVALFVDFEFLFCRIVCVLVTRCPVGAYLYRGVGHDLGVQDGGSRHAPDCE